MSSSHTKTFAEWATEARISQEMEVHREFLELLEPVVEKTLNHWEEEAKVSAHGWQIQNSMVLTLLLLKTNKNSTRGSRPS